MGTQGGIAPVASRPWVQIPGYQLSDFFPQYGTEPFTLAYIPSPFIILGGGGRAYIPCSFIV